ncbi:hypothetical protein N9104_02135 [Pseudomonadales bacterium]|nr:hypothetical protein [bacterium]MDB4567541.1 hypothetical protein [Pseudomonadales bacterium]
MENMELDVGGTKIKGVWIAVLISFATTIGGGIWTASEFFSRIEAVEDLGVTVPLFIESTGEDLSDFKSRVAVIEEELKVSDIDNLQGKLVQLGTNLKTIMDRQQELVALQERVVEVEKLVKDMQVTVTKAEIATEKSDEVNKKLDRIQKEVDNLWDGMDYLANPMGGSIK